MGFVLSILYLVTYYLSPATVIGQLAAYRIELILALLALFASLPALMKSFVFRVPQSLAVIGMFVAVVLSIAIGMHWPGAAPQALFDFIPNAFAFFLVCLHFKTKKRLQGLVAMLMFVCLFVIAHGYIAELHGFPAELAHQPGFDGSPYLLAMMNNSGVWFYRLRGMGEINDPNDFAQLLVCVIPLVFIFWRQRKTFWNAVVVILPVSALLFGTYLTHSRGSLLALIALVIMSARRRIGTVLSLFLAAGLFFVATALNFAGGRDISTLAGEDRSALWGESMQLLKTHPLFGVGYAQLPDYLGHTAHNSVMVCAAELGLFGLYFWCLFLFPVARDALAVASPEKVFEGDQVLAEQDPFPHAMRKTELLDKAEINRLGSLIVLSLTGYLVAGWFLSRAYVVTLFLLGAIAEVIFEMALCRGMISPRIRLKRVVPYAGVLAVSLLVFMYISLRIMNLTH